MKLKTIKSLGRLRGKVILLRLDLNAPVTNGRLDPSDLWKLKASLPTLHYLRARQAAIIIISHRGEPRGWDHDLSLKPIVAKLSRLLGQSIPVWADDFDACRAQAKKLKPGEIVCLENIRFHHEEYSNSSDFAERLAVLGDLYVNDAFGAIHRKQASVVALARQLPSYAGLLLEHEVMTLLALRGRLRKPAVAIIGGNKISTKIRLIKKLLRRVDWLLLGGALANTVLASMDYGVGRSMIEPDMVSWSKSLLDNKLKVPVDARVATSLRGRVRISAVASVKKREIIYDIGPDTERLYQQVVSRARTVIWNGPLGYFEDKKFARGTKALVQALAKTRARVYLGGGETVKAVLEAGLESKIYFISTGGGAMLTVLEGRPMPALTPLIQR